MSFGGGSGGGGPATVSGRNWTGPNADPTATAMGKAIGIYAPPAGNPETITRRVQSTNSPDAAMARQMRTGLGQEVSFNDQTVRNPWYDPNYKNPTDTLTDTTTTTIPGSTDVNVTTKKRKPERQPVNGNGGLAGSLLSSADGGMKSLLGE